MASKGALGMVFIIPFVGDNVIGAPLLWLISHLLAREIRRELAYPRLSQRRQEVDGREKWPPQRLVRVEFKPSLVDERTGRMHRMVKRDFAGSVGGSGAM